MKRQKVYFGRSVLFSALFTLWHVQTSTFAVEPTTDGAAKTLDHGELWSAGEGGYHTYRIPSLIVAKDGTLLAFCEGRVDSRADHGEIHLLLRRSTDNGKTWSPTQVVWKDGGNTCGNPCPVVDQETGTIWMLMNWNRGEDHGKALHGGTAKDTRRVYVTSSTDHGKTWSAPKEITEIAKRPEWLWHATGPGVGIQIQNGPHRGRLVIPCDYTKKDEQIVFGSCAVVSDDYGKTWRLAGTVGPHTNECQVVELDDGKGTLMMNLRSELAETDARWQSISRDGGDTWTQIEKAANLPCPKCQGSIVRYPWKASGENRILFSNPADPNRRRNMTVRMSTDNGETWPLAKTIHAGPAAYSCLAALPDDSIGLLYEGGTDQSYEAIRFVRFKIDELSAAP